MQGFLNLDKPAGLTSHDCVGQVRRLLKLKRVGHGGTLDPAATGVLPIALGPATRLLSFLPTGKAYRATLRFGHTTTTDDLEGETLRQTPVTGFDPQAVQALLPRFIGAIAQVPPAYSALHVNGRRAYDLARAGETVSLAARTVEIYSLDWLGWRGGDFPEVDLAVRCGPGTYIRSLARDLGQALGTGATLAGLVRTHSAGFDLAESLSLAQVGEQVAAGEFCPLSPAAALAHWPSVVLAGDRLRDWYFGRAIILDSQEPIAPSEPLPEPLRSTPPPPGMVRALTPQGELAGLGELGGEGGQRAIAPRLVLPA